MSEDLMRYDLLAQEALRGVVRTALERVAESGLPGEHHFYISFDMNAPGVRTSERLRKQYPEEMTIVLQHQFWGLKVEQDRFTVELSFNNVPEKLVVPFDAVKGFFDPSVQFGLQFEMGEPAAANADEAGGRKPAGKDGAEAGPSAALAGPAAEKAAAEDSDAAAASGKAAGGNQAAESGEAAESADVVQLDAFRKKK